jgi:dTDP-4-amino-4,6-dideoxygalactose transaminase
MKKILFNTVNKSCNYTKNIELLFSDYELFRKKHFSTLSINKLEQTFTNSELFLTHSATGALEIIATLLEIEPGDEIIMPSFSFISTASAFVNKGAIPIFIDIDSTTLNIDTKLIEQAITSKTKAIIAMHYGGNSCDLNALKSICDQHNLLLIEDAAMGFGGVFEGKPLGTFGDLSVISFDITKHIQAIQGGLLIVNNKKFCKRAHYIYNIGTNRNDYQNGDVPYYEWVDYGSKYQMNELNAAVLFEQLNNSEDILNHRKKISKLYYEKLRPFELANAIKLMPFETLNTNIHEFYILLNSEQERDDLRNHLNDYHIEALFHYNPLHKSIMGAKKGRYIGFNNTEMISKKLLRLPFHNEITETDINYIVVSIESFFNKKDLI